MAHYSVLIVDDSSLNRLALKSYFTQLGHSVVGLAASAEEAKSLFTKVKPNLMTIDQVMPGQNGAVLAKWVNDQDKTSGRDTKILFITGDPLRSTTKATINVTKYILKPATKSKIEEALNKIK